MGISDTGIVSPSRGLRLFVYGSLKKGHLNHKLLVDGRKISDGHTVETFLMMNAGEFPVVLERGNGVAAMLPVTGELYEIEDRMLAALDELEDRGRMYDRRTFQIRTATGSVVPAIMYVGRPQYWSSVPGLEVVKIHNGFYAWRP